jgi:hypothetical protein
LLPGKFPVAGLARPVWSRCEYFQFTILTESLDLLARVSTILIAFGEMHRCISEQGKIQDVQPDDRLVALIAVVVPVPGGRENNIASRQGHFLALHGSEPVAFHNEPEGICDMPMGGSCLSRVH